MDISNDEVVQFDHIYDGARHRCGYRVAGGKLVVVVGERERMAELDRMTPQRLAHILVREWLVEADFAREREKRAIDPTSS